MSAIAVYILALLILSDGSGALLSASVFAVHPVHAEAVTWISGRSELLWALFMLSSFSLYIVYKKRKGITHIAGSLALFFLSLLSKETAIIFPLVLMLYELFYGTEGLKRRVRFPVFYALTIIPYIILRTEFLKNAGLVGNQSLLLRMYTAPGLFAEYLRLLILPFNLKVFYDVSIKKTFLSPDVIVPLIVLGLILVGTLFVRRHDKGLSFSLLFALIVLIPVTGIVRLLYPAFMADRYLYVPSVGFSMALGTLYAAIARKTEPTPDQKTDSMRGSFWFSNKVRLGGAFIVAALLILTFQRNYRWKDDVTFMRTMVKDAPNSDFAHYNLGTVYDRMGRFEEALKEYQVALTLRPNNAQAHNNLGILYEKTGRLDEAVKEYQAAVKLDPSHAKAFSNLGLLFRRMSRAADALRTLQDAVSFNPSDSSLHNTLGAVYLEQKRFNEAAGEIQIALRLNPDYVEAHNNLGLLFKKMNRLDDATREFQVALGLNPQYAEAHSNLGIVYVMQGRIEDAITEFNRALSIEPHNEAFRSNFNRAKEQRKKGF
jgi:Flp pilus assembly protein TadD